MQLRHGERLLADPQHVLKFSCHTCVLGLMGKEIVLMNYFSGKVANALWWQGSMTKHRSSSIEVFSLLAGMSTALTRIVTQQKGPDNPKLCRQEIQEKGGACIRHGLD